MKLSCGDRKGRCCEGNEHLCVRQKITGVTVDDGYWEFVAAPGSHATKIPEGLVSAQAARLSHRLASAAQGEHCARPSADGFRRRRLGTSRHSDWLRVRRGRGGVHVALVTPPPRQNTKPPSIACGGPGLFSSLACRPRTFAYRPSSCVLERSGSALPGSVPS